MPVNGSDVKVVYYTRSAYNNLSTKDDNTIYYVQETNGRLSLYIGTRSMGYATEGYVDTKVAPKLDSNPAIVGGTSPKITYDSKGLVTGGSSLVAGDIPNLPASKTTSGTFADARIPSLNASKINAGVFGEARIPALSPTKITQNASNRFVTDAEKSTWNDKQDKLVAGSGIDISGNVISSTGGGGSGWELLYLGTGLEQSSVTLTNFNALLGDYKIFAAFVLTSYEDTSITFYYTDDWSGAEQFSGRELISSYYSSDGGSYYLRDDGSYDILDLVIWGVSK